MKWKFIIPMIAATQVFGLNSSEALELCPPGDTTCTINTATLAIRTAKSERKIIDLITGADVLSKGLANVNTDVNALKAGVKTVTDGLSKANTDINALKGAVQGQSGSLSNMSTDINALKAGIAGHTSTLSNINTDVNALKAGVKTITDGLSKANTDVNLLKGRASSLESAVSGHTNSISNLSSDVNSVKSAVAGHTSSISNLSSDVNSVKSAVSGHTTSISNMSSSLNALTARVAALENGGGSGSQFKCTSFNVNNGTPKYLTRQSDGSILWQDGSFMYYRNAGYSDDGSVVYPEINGYRNYDLVTRSIGYSDDFKMRWPRVNGSQQLLQYRGSSISDGDMYYPNGDLFFSPNSQSYGSASSTSMSQTFGNAAVNVRLNSDESIDVKVTYPTNPSDFYAEVNVNSKSGAIIVTECKK